MHPMNTLTNTNQVNQEPNTKEIKTTNASNNIEDDEKQVITSSTTTTNTNNKRENAQTHKQYEDQDNHDDKF